MCDQIITVEDTTDPVVTCPGPITVECEADVPVADFTGGTATDNCDANLDITSTDGPLVGGACGGTITRTWTATDDCGNQTVCDQIITVEDTTDPVVTCPGPITVECEADVPVADFTGGTATDNCDANLDITSTDGPLVGGACGGTITRTWTATDDCGNQTVCDQIITVEDTTDPVVTCPGPITVECEADVPVADFTGGTATDNCDANLDITSTDGPLVGGACGGTITRTWTATDDCGNQTVCDQIITVEDTTDPVVTCPGPITVECEADVPVADFTGGTATDNCDANLDITSTDGPLVGGACGGTITRTWTATDDCGNQTVCDQIITVEDTTDPVVTCPGPITVECEADVPVADFTGGTATDNCDANLDITSTDGPLVGGACGGTITRTWTATDDCGNQTVCDQIITVEDTTDPVVTCPGPITVECEADVPVADFTGGTATDNCDANLDITSTDGPLVGGACGGTITRTWTATDDCGNQTVCDQIITVEDTTAPLLIGIPADQIVECDEIPGVADPTATDNCDTDVDIEFVEVITPGSCPFIITRTWTATDNCGNTDEQSQTITVQDLTPPVLAGVPTDVTVECDAIPGPDILSATDNCDTDIEITFDETIIAGACLDSYAITRTWTATDNCNNTDQQTQLITVQDNTPPVLTGMPADITIDCDAVPEPAVPTATDNCDTDIEITFDETTTAGTCLDSYTIMRTWTATDNCGNSDEQTQVITVQDVTAPVLAGVPTDVTVDCDAIPGPAVPTVTDNCDTDIEITFDETIIAGACLDSYTITRTWTATDNCGNLDEQTRVITVAGCYNSGFDRSTNGCNS